MIDHAMVSFSVAESWLDSMLTAAAPMVAELPQPIPMATNISLCIVAIISVCFLRKVDEDEDDHKKNKESGKNLS